MSSEPNIVSIKLSLFGVGWPGRGPWNTSGVSGLGFPKAAACNPQFTVFPVFLDSGWTGWHKKTETLENVGA